MARFFIFIVISGGVVLSMYSTKPTSADYLSELESRAANIASIDQNAFAQLRGGDPFDEMVAAQSPYQLLKQTHIDDHVVFSVFTTEYEAPGYAARQVRTYGVYATLFTVRND